MATRPKIQTGLAGLKKTKGKKKSQTLESCSLLQANKRGHVGHPARARQASEGGGEGPLCERQQRRTSAGERPATLRHAATEAAPSLWHGRGRGGNHAPRRSTGRRARCRRRRKQLRVSRLPFSPRRLLKHTPSLSGTAASGLAVPPEWADVVMANAKRATQTPGSRCAGHERPIETGTSTFISATRTCRPPASRQTRAIARFGTALVRHPKHRRGARSGKRAQTRNSSLGNRRSAAVGETCRALPPEAAFDNSSARDARSNVFSVSRAVTSLCHPRRKCPGSPST